MLICALRLSVVKADPIQPSHFSFQTLGNRKLPTPIPPLTLPLRKMNIPRRGARENRPANRALSLRYNARFLALMAEEVAEG